MTAGGGTSPFLELDRLTRRFGGLVAVQDVSFSLAEGSIAAIIGPNGAGKTTVFNMVSAITPPSSGAFRFRGETPRRPHQAAALGITRTFQNIRLFRDMTVEENVLVGLAPRLRSGFLGILAGSRSVAREEVEARARAAETLAFVGLAAAASCLARELPYGHQRRAEIARALVSRPGLVLLDEPTAGMNPTESAALTALIRRIRDELGVTVLLIEHDMSVVMGISERVVVLDHGEKIADGPPEAVREDPKVIEAYLGRKRSGRLRRTEDHA